MAVNSHAYVDDIRKKLEALLDSIFEDDEEIKIMYKALPDDKLVEATAKIMKIVLASDNKNLN